jgi:hypothetical protein
VNKTWQIFPRADASFSRDSIDVDDMFGSSEPAYSHHLTPLQLKSIPIYQGPTTRYELNKTMYQYEYLLLPRVVFYVLRRDIKQTLSALLELFPDDKVDELIQPHDYPRLNIRVSKMIYIADGSADDKINTIRSQAQTDHIFFRNISNRYDLPLEYQEKQKSCNEHVSPRTCNQANAYSRYYSDNDVCHWNDESKTCAISNTYSPHLLFERNPDGSPKSIQGFFKEIGHEELYRDERLFPLPHEGKRRNRRYQKKSKKINKKK